MGDFGIDGLDEEKRRARENDDGKIGSVEKGDIYT